ncbi:protein SPT2 homolog [Zingiber officinale]|uniref:protein SPT2 homolog n=1 Tax=Zingiber officinale TaxID=94328 RepID=UPI001C4B7F86|nr:protein SPT2 homolog [Zingiber officinale]
MYRSEPREKYFDHRSEGYDAYEDDYDEYEEETSEYEREEEPKPRKPTKEEQDFLKLREQLKDQIRKKLKRENASAFGCSSQSQQSKRTNNDNKFGSFFGPSEPVIASRVIEESKSIRETKHIIENRSSSVIPKREGPSSAATITNHQHYQQPKVVNEMKRKAQALKDMRDYSFLLSDDADLPDAKEEIRPRSSPPKAYGQSVQRPPPVHSKLPMNKSANSASISNGLRKTDPSKQLMQRKTGPTREAPVNRPKPAPTKLASVQYKTGMVGNASGKSVGNNMMQRKVPPGQVVGTNRPAQVVGSIRPVQVVGSNRPSQVVGSNRPVQVVGSNRPSQVVGSNRPSQVFSSNKPAQVVGSNRPAQVVGSNRLPSKVANDPRLKKDISTARQQLPPQKHHPEQRRPTQGTDQVRKIVKQPMPPPRPQPSKQNLSRGSYDERPKKRPAPRNLSDDDEVDYRSLIRGMFRYNPNKYAGDDEDDSDMEVGFDTIQREEQRSSLIAKREDEEQLRLIEEEEERERQRRQKKKSRMAS